MAILDRDNSVFDYGTRTVVRCATHRRRGLRPNKQLHERFRLRERVHLLRRYMRHAMSRLRGLTYDLSFTSSRSRHS